MSMGNCFSVPLFREHGSDTVPQNDHYCEILGLVLCEFLINYVMYASQVTLCSASKLDSKTREKSFHTKNIKIVGGLQFQGHVSLLGEKKKSFQKRHDLILHAV